MTDSEITKARDISDRRLAALRANGENIRTTPRVARRAGRA
jgi:hypothetical protein